MEENAFRHAVADHRDVVFRIALTYLRDPADADDVTQDVFLKLLQSDNRFESGQHIRNWLIRVTVNECKSLFRKPWKRVDDIELYANQLEIPNRESRELFVELMRLKRTYRVPVFLYYYMDLSTQEIAELLKIPSATVRTRLARGRQKLKALLEDDEDVF